MEVGCSPPEKVAVWFVVTNEPLPRGMLATTTSPMRTRWSKNNSHTTCCTDDYIPVADTMSSFESKPTLVHLPSTSSTSPPRPRNEKNQVALTATLDLVPPFPLKSPYFSTNPNKNHKAPPIGAAQASLRREGAVFVHSIHHPGGRSAAITLDAIVVANKNYICNSFLWLSTPHTRRGGGVERKPGQSQDDVAHSPQISVAPLI